MIELRDLCLHFGDKAVLQGFTLSLPETGILALSGPSGCGKTTLARVLAGLESPESGEIRGLSGNVALLFQEDRLLPWWSAAQNIAAVSSDQAARQFLAAVGLADEADALPSELSGGMRRRVALARALAFESSLLILDEPFNGIDEAAKQALYPLIHEAAQNKPVLLITHRQDEREALADRTVFLDGTPLTILRTE
jgi:NitT/TauT family transport system ATP-binding protein